MEETNTPVNAENNEALKIADIFADALRPSQSADSEILNIVAKYSLQLRLDQQQVITKLLLLTHDSRIPDQARKQIQVFIPDYMTNKRFHDTLPFIGRTVEAMSLRKFWNQDAMKGQIIKTQ